MSTLHALPFFGHQVVRGAFVLAAFGWGIGFYGPPIYLHAVVVRTGWPLTLVSAAVTLHFLGGVLVVANLHRLHARFGLPRSIVGGAVLASTGVCGWALASEPWQLFVAALLSGAGWVTMGAVAVNALVSPWHARTRPQALARAYNGASIGGVVFMPLWVALIAGVGFVAAAAVVGAVTVVVMALLAHTVFRHTPQSLAQAADGDLASTAPVATDRLAPPPTPLPGRQLWRDRAFLTLATGMALGLFAQIGLLAHLYGLLVPRLGAQPAAWLMGGATGVAIVGRSAAARLLRRFGDRRRVAAAGYAVQVIGSLLLLFAVVGEAAAGWLVLGVALFGSGIGNATSLPPLIAQHDFAPADVPRVVSLIVACSQASYAFAPAVFATLLSLLSAEPAGIGFFVAAAAVQCAAACALLIGRRDRG